MTMDLSERYLELLKKSLLDELYIENEARLVYILLSLVAGTPVEEQTIREISRRRPDILNRLCEARVEGKISFIWTVNRPDGSTNRVNLRNLTEVYHTMIGRKRLDNLHALLGRVIADGVPGDLIETGVWRGGATIFMRGFLAARAITDRRVWVADSFAGLPAPSTPQDRGYDFSAKGFPILAIGRQEVEDLFRRYDLMDEQVRFLEGWFKETLPDAPIEHLALIRLDGDLYESTRDAINALYDKLSPGGFVIVDDYHDFEPCRRAIDEFRAQRAISAPIERIDWTGVWWRKEQ